MRLNPAGRSRCPQMASATCQIVKANSPMTVIHSSVAPNGPPAISASAPFCDASSPPPPNQAICRAIQPIRMCTTP